MQTSTTGLRLTWLAAVTPNVEVSTSGTPQTDNHHASFQLAALFEELCMLLEAAGITMARMFLNADSIFDINELCQTCATRNIEANIDRNRRATDWQIDNDTSFDFECYHRCAVVEHANTWLDSFKTLLVRHETSVGNWLVFHWPAFVILFSAKKLRLKRLSKPLIYFE